MALQAADTRAQPAGLDFQLLAELQLAVDERAGDDGTEAGDGEDAVNRQPRSASAWPRAFSPEKIPDDLEERVEANACRGRARDDRRAAQGRRTQELFDVGL